MKCCLCDSEIENLGNNSLPLMDDNAVIYAIRKRYFQLE